MDSPPLPLEAGALTQLLQELETQRQAMQGLQNQLLVQQQQLQQQQLQQPQMAPRDYPKPPKPDTFNGDRQKADDWLFGVSHYFGLLNQNLPEEYKINFTVNLLKEEAMHWWQGLVRAEGTHPYPTFEAFKRGFLSQFAPVNGNAVARDRLDALRQTGTVEAYISAFNKVTARITDLSAAETLHRFVKGLRPTVNAWVKTKGCTTLHEAMSAAQAVGDYGAPGIPTQHGDPMDVDAIELEVNALSMRRPKDRRPIVHTNVSGNGRPPPGGTFRDPPPLKPGEMETLRAENKCFRCRKEGHRASECRTFPKGVRFADGR